MGSLARASAPLRCHPGRHSARRERGRTPASSRNEEPMTVSRIATTNAPAAVGPYSQGVSTGQGAGSFVFVSGQVPLDPATGALVEGDIQAQAEQVLKNVGAILAEAGLGYDDVVKTTVLLADIADFAAVNEVYARYFTGETLPARAAFGVAALPLGAGVEIEAIAARS